jgi:hypothetical protein
VKQLIATTVLLALIGCASAQDYNRSDNDPQGNPEYTSGQFAADIFLCFLGLGSPFKGAIDMQKSIDTHEQNMAAKERERVSDIATRQLGGRLAAMNDPDSLYFKDATHLNDLFAASPEARAYLGGSYEATPTGRKSKAGDEIYAVRIFDPQTNEDIITFNETTKGIITWFDAQFLPSVHPDATSYSNEIKPEQGFGHSWDNKNIYMQPYKHNAYGLGIHSDATGKPFEWKTQNGQTSHSNKVKPDAYGPGVGMDEYGRPVKPSPWGQ